MTDKILLDLTSMIFLVSWVLFIYYGLVIGMNIEELYSIGGNLAEVFYIDRLKDVTSKALQKMFMKYRKVM